VPEHYASVAPTHAAVVVGIGLEWNSVLSHKFVQPGCTTTTNQIQVGEMLLYEGVEAYKKEKADEIVGFLAL
jgi:hypothetical protein